MYPIFLVYVSFKALSESEKLEFWGFIIGAPMNVKSQETQKSQSFKTISEKEASDT